MLDNVNPTQTANWVQLRAHQKVLANQHIKDLFQDDPQRAPKFTLQFEDILVDFSKNMIKEAKKVLIAPAQQGIMVQAEAETLKAGLLGRAVVKGDVLVMGGVRRRKDIMGDGLDMEDIFGDIEESNI